MNPSFSDIDIIGNWADGKSSFRLMPEGNAELKLSEEHVKILGHPKKTIACNHFQQTI